MKDFNEQNFKEQFKLNLERKYVKSFEDADRFEKYSALSETIMDLITKNWTETNKQNKDKRNALVDH